MTLKDKIKPSTPKYTIPQLCVELVHSAHVAQIEHWNTNSYAQHVALGGYYEGVPDLADQIAEEYIGIYGKQEFSENKIKSSNFVEYLNQLYEFATNAQKACDCTNVLNKIDEVKSLIASTKYKLENLK
jgi:hypothetical protein